MTRRVLFTTGEPSGEQIAVLLAQALARVEPDVAFEGLGGRRMLDAGFHLRARMDGMSSLGPIQAVPRIPKLLALGKRLVAELLRDPVDLIVCVDYGAFNLRFARELRARGYTKPIVYAFPPSAWHLRENVNVAVAAVAIPAVPFLRQAAAYAAQGLSCLRPGHPLADAIPARPRCPRAPIDGGHIAFMPGSREQELRYHVPVMLAAFEFLRARRPEVRGTFISASPEYTTVLKRAIAGRPSLAVDEDGRAVLGAADAALVKSGTAVLEAALLQIPTASLYVLSPRFAWFIRNVMRFRGEFVTLPNLVLDRMCVVERLQENAQPDTLAFDLEALLLEPERQLADFVELRAALGGADTLAQWGTLLCDALHGRAAIMRKGQA